MPDWKLKYNEKEIDVDYHVIHLTKDGKTEYIIHEIQYKRHIFRGKSIEDVVGDLVKMIERREKR